LHTVKVFPGSQPDPPASGLGVHKKQGEDTAGTAESSWPKGYPILYGVMVSTQSSGKKKQEGTFRVMAFFFPS